MKTIGVISDTHGLLRPEAVAALAGVDHIIHAGDIGSAQILDQLQRIAPVTAVRGNNDKDLWAQHLPDTQIVEIGGRRIHVLHDLSKLDLDPAAADLAAVVSGHSHKPRIAEESAILFLNPGSAGPRRFKLPVTIAKLHVQPHRLSAQVIDLLRSPTDRSSQ